jgi:hypothetical protein
MQWIDDEILIGDFEVTKPGESEGSATQLLLELKPAEVPHERAGVELDRFVFGAIRRREHMSPSDLAFERKRDEHIDVVPPHEVYHVDLLAHEERQDLGERPQLRVHELEAHGAGRRVQVPEVSIDGGRPQRAKSITGFHVPGPGKF